MPDSVLVAFDGSPPSERALTYAVENFLNATIVATYVINPIDSIADVESGGLPVAEGWYDDAQERATAIQTTARTLAADHDIELETVTGVGKPAREIVRYAEEHDIDQIVMGSHGRSGVGRAILGSVAEAVTRRARIPVTIVR
ncbi:universal stress protein [Halorubrum ejinorense]|uniref:Universal stress protein n=1 Tax=Halorubrum ejinorense TaxID=425309 RepID=A0AAV3SUD5_9EURY